MGETPNPSPRKAGRAGAVRAVGRSDGAGVRTHGRAAGVRSRVRRRAASSQGEAERPQAARTTSRAGRARAGRLVRRAPAWALVAAIALASRAAGAQGANDLQVAQALYDEAAKGVAAKDYAAACPKLEEAARLVPEGVGVRLALGACYEAWGRLASALATYEMAEAVAARAHQAARQRYAHERAATLKPRVAKLRVVVADDVRALPGLENPARGEHRRASAVGPRAARRQGRAHRRRHDGRRPPMGGLGRDPGRRQNRRPARRAPSPKEPPPMPAGPRVVPASKTDPAADAARPRRIAGSSSDRPGSPVSQWAQRSASRQS